MARQRGGGTLRELTAVLVDILTKPAFIAAAAVGVAATYVFVCRQEAEWRAADPRGWRLMYGSQLPQAIPCSLICVCGALTLLIPLVILVYLKRRRQASGR